MSHADGCRAGLVVGLLEYPSTGLPKSDCGDADCGQRFVDQGHCHGREQHNVLGDLVYGRIERVQFRKCRTPAGSKNHAGNRPLGVDDRQCGGHHVRSL